MNFKTLCLLFFILTISEGSELKKKAEHTLSVFYPKGYAIKYQKYSIPAEVKNNIEKKVRQKFFRPEVYLWRIYVNADSLNYAILDNTLGKSLPITFLVIFDGKGEVIYSTILKYRESIGGAVASSAWNKQFWGKSDTSYYKIGRDINGISGATISVHSVTKGIQKLSFLVREIIKND